jgi:hypothetical protein
MKQKIHEICTTSHNKTHEIRKKEGKKERKHEETR